MAWNRVPFLAFNLKYTSVVDMFVRRCMASFPGNMNFTLISYARISITCSSIALVYMNQFSVVYQQFNRPHPRWQGYIGPTSDNGWYGWPTSALGNLCWPNVGPTRHCDVEYQIMVGLIWKRWRWTTYIGRMLAQCWTTMKFSCCFLDKNGNIGPTLYQWL